MAIIALVAMVTVSSLVLEWKVPTVAVVMATVSIMLVWELMLLMYLHPAASFALAFQ